jgi:LysM repeat protein
MRFARSIYIVAIASLLTVKSFAGGSDSKIMLDGKSYTLHKVKAGETLLSITKEYNANIFDLRKINRLATDNSVKVDDILIIPLATTTQPAAVAAKPAVKQGVQTPIAPTTQGEQEHTVMPGETLFSISRQYHTTPAAIKAANGMTDNGLRAGQKLKIPVAGNTPAAPAKAAPAPPVVNKVAAPTVVQPIPPKAAAPADITPAIDPTVDSKMLAQLKAEFQAQTKTKRTIEAARGVATVMQDDTKENQAKFYAFHKTAAIGTILKVRNLMNNRIAYVKVIGKLPENVDTQSVMIKVSSATAKYLTVLDAKFQCEVTEYK